jgi:hypothetical protein
VNAVSPPIELRFSVVAVSKHDPGGGDSIPLRSPFPTSGCGRGMDMLDITRLFLSTSYAGVTALVARVSYSEGTVSAEGDHKKRPYIIMFLPLHIC